MNQFSELRELVAQLREVPYATLHAGLGGAPVPVGARMHRAADLLEFMVMDNIRFYEGMARIGAGDPDAQALATEVLYAPSYLGLFQ